MQSRPGGHMTQSWGRILHLNVPSSSVTIPVPHGENVLRWMITSEASNKKASIFIQFFYSQCLLPILLQKWWAMGCFTLDRYTEITFYCGNKKIKVICKERVKLRSLQSEWGRGGCVMIDWIHSSPGFGGTSKVEADYLESECDFHFGFQLRVWCSAFIHWFGRSRQWVSSVKSRTDKIIAYSSERVQTIRSLNSSMTFHSTDTKIVTNCISIKKPR